MRKGGVVTEVGNVFTRLGSHYNSLARETVAVLRRLTWGSEEFLDADGKYEAFRRRRPLATRDGLPGLTV